MMGSWRLVNRLEWSWSASIRISAARRLVVRLFRPTVLILILMMCSIGRHLGGSKLLSCCFQLPLQRSRQIILRFVARHVHHETVSSRCGR